MAEAPFIRVELGPGKETIQFKDYEELKAWILAEQPKWSWLISYMNSDGNLSNILNNGQMWAINNLHSHIMNYQGNPEGSRQQVIEIFRNYLGGQRAVRSESPAGKFILKMAEKEPVQAAWALAMLTAPAASLNLNAQSTASMDGVLRAVLWLNGLKGTALSEKAALDDLFLSAKESHRQNQEVIDDSRNALKAFDVDREERLAAFELQRDQAVKAAADTFDAELVVAKQRLAALERTYEAHLALSAPVRYWQRKARTHSKSLKWMIGTTLGAALLFVAGISLEVRYLMPTIDGKSWPQPWKLGLVLLSLTMVIWLLRLLVKVTLSQLHLKTDAEERMVFANAYLALLKRDKAIDPTDREMILQTLFRPSATGIVDDGGPATPIEIITRAISGKAGNS